MPKPSVTGAVQVQAWRALVWTVGTTCCLLLAFIPWFISPPPRSLYSIPSISSALNQSFCLKSVLLLCGKSVLVSCRAQGIFLSTYHMADIVLRHVTYVILFNPSLMPWQVYSVSLLLLARQLRDREPKQHSKQQRANWNSDMSDFKVPNFTDLH